LNNIEKNKQVLLHLFLIEDIGISTGLKILTYLFFEKYKQVLESTSDLCLNMDRLRALDLTQIYSYTEQDFIGKTGLTRKKALILHIGLKDQKSLEEELELIQKYKIDILTIFDDTYPDCLRNIHRPPLLLYIKGRALCEYDKSMAIVGSRKADMYAKQVIIDLVPSLVKHNWDIVSGGASGVDTMAHAQTLEAGGSTIVVLGAGLMQPYPPRNKDLFRKIVRNGGTLVSSFPLRNHPERKNFPMRNRIISGLSHGCIVVQAAQRSGALITAHYALDQGRQVFAVPGSVHHELSMGCHKLIAQGAKLVNNVNDILSEFGERASQQTLINFSGARASGSQDIAQKNTRNFCTKKSGQRILQKKDRVQDPILQLLEASSTLDELSSKSGLSLSELQDKLFALQLDGKVRQNFTGAWELAA